MENNQIQKGIIRVEHNKDNPYVILNKTVLDDERLSFKAKGIASYLLSKPDNWETNVEHLVKVSKDGRDSVYSGLQELREYGYMIKAPYKDDKGKIVGWENVVYEVPNEKAVEIYKNQNLGRKKKEEEKPLTENPEVEEKPLTENPEVEEKEEKPLTDFPDTEKPDREKPDREKPEILINKEVPINELTNNDYREEGADLPSPSEVLEGVKGIIKGELTEVTFKTWIEPLEAVEVKEDILYISALNEFSKGILEDRYNDLILKSLKAKGYMLKPQYTVRG